MCAVAHPHTDTCCESNTMNTYVSPCAGVSCVVPVKGAPGKANASSGADGLNAGTPVTGAGACTTHTRTHTHTHPSHPSLTLSWLVLCPPISPGPGTDLLLTCTLPKFRVLLNTTGYCPPLLTLFPVMSLSHRWMDGRRGREHDQQRPRDGSPSCLSGGNTPLTFELAEESDILLETYALSVPRQEET